MRPLDAAKVGGISEKSRWNQPPKQPSDLLLRSAHHEEFNELRHKGHEPEMVRDLCILRVRLD
jgi:hypothetical protein